MEVVAGISSIVQVIDSVTRVAKRLNEVRESYNNVALNTTLVASQLSTIRAALKALHEWRASDRDSSRASKQFDQDLGMSLDCCAILISVIDGKLDDSGHMPGLKQKIKYLWLEDILKEYISNLEGQVRALQLLLTIFQCRTEAEKRQKLENVESRTIIEQVRAETASLARGNTSIQDAASVLSLDPSVTLDIDSILLKSPAYKRVYGNARLRLPPPVAASHIENSEQATRPAPTTFSNEMLQPPLLPPQATQKPMPQSRARTNVRDYYPSDEEQDRKRGKTTIAHSEGVPGLSGETQLRSIVQQRNEQYNMLQREETAIESINRNAQQTGAESSIDSFTGETPLSTQTAKILSTAPPAAIDDTKALLALEDFGNLLNRAFAEKSPTQNDERGLSSLYGTAAPLKSEKSHTLSVSREEGSQVGSREASTELRRYSNPRSEDFDPAPSPGKYLGKESQKPTSTHSSLYASSIVPAPTYQSTGTSSPFSCVSCKNIVVTDHLLGNDTLEGDTHDFEHSSPQPDSVSVDGHQDATDQSLMNVDILDHSQLIPARGSVDTSDRLRSLPEEDVSPLFSKSKTIEKNTHDKGLITHSTPPVDDVDKPYLSDLERIQMTTPIVGLGLQDVKALERTSAPPQEIKSPCSNMYPAEFVIPTISSAPPNAPAVVFPPSARSKSSESEQSIVSSDRLSSVHDATSTVSSSEARNSNSLSIQQSTPDTTATSLSTHPTGFDRNNNLSDLPRLQNELATAKARGDSRAVQDSLQRSIQFIRRKYLIDPPAADDKATEKSPSPRPGKARSNILRLPSLASSTKGVALGDSAASGNTASLQNALKEKVNVDSRSDNFKTPLMRAAVNGHLECMKLLKDFGADEFAVDARGRTAFHLAVSNNRLAAVKWLLESYPPIKADPLRHRPSILFRATDVVKGVRPQKNLREASDAEGSRPLHIAAELDKGSILKTLIAAGVDIESKDNRGRTPLQRAITSKHRESFDTLLGSGAKVNAVDAKSGSPLHLAAEAGQVDIIETLLANGARRWDFDADGNQPIHSAVWGGNIFAVEALVTERIDLDKRTKSGQTLLHLACLKRDLEIARYLLTRLVDVNPWAAPSSSILPTLSHTRIKGSSMTPLHYACCTHDFEMTVLLLGHKAWVNAGTPEGVTALMMAVETEDTNLVNLLLEGGAKVNAKIPGSLITAFHLAARRGDLETVQQLCRQGADVGARTSSSSNSKSPLEECWKCPNKTKSHAVEAYIRTVLKNKRNRTLRDNARNVQASRSESFQSYQNPPGAQISPLANPVGYTPLSRVQQDYSQDQEQWRFGGQATQAQNPQWYHPDFDVPDEALPAYEAGPNAPARLVNRAPVYRE